MDLFGKEKKQTQKANFPSSSQGWFPVQLHNSRAKSRAGVRGMKGESVLWCNSHQTAVLFYHCLSWLRGLGVTPSRISWSECMGKFYWCFWVTWLFSVISGIKSSRECCLSLITDFSDYCFSDTGDSLSCFCVFPPPYLPCIFTGSLGWL